MKKLLAGLLAAMMLVSIIACAGDDSGADGGLSELGYDFSDLPVFDVAGTTIRVGTWDPDGDDFTAAFEEWSGATLEWIFIDDDNYEEVVMAGVMAGNPPDAVEFYTGRGLSMMNAGLLQPLDDLIDFDHWFWDFHNDIEHGLMDGSRYLAVIGREGWFHMFYNYSMFEAEGMETPTEMMDRGAWTWENLLNLARHFTRDTTGDGINDMVGIATDWTGYLPMMMMVTYNATLVRLDADGILHNNVNDPVLAHVANLCHYFIVEGLIDYDLHTFLSGNAPMFLGGAWYIWDEVKSEMLINREIAMIPSPTPGGGIEGVRMGNMEGYAIPRNAANPEGAAAFMYFNRWYTEIREVEDQDMWGLTEREFNYFGGLNFSEATDDFFPGVPYWDAIFAIIGGEEWATTREVLFPQTQLVVDDFNQGR